MSDTTERAASPEDLTRLFVELGNAGDADGLADLYEPDAVMAYPPGHETVGRAAIREVLAQMLVHVPHRDPEPPLPTLRCGDLALTSTRSADGKGTRVQVARRQADGSWLRVIDRPELPADAR